MHFTFCYSVIRDRIKFENSSSCAASPGGWSRENLCNRWRLSGKRVLRAMMIKRERWLVLLPPKGGVSAVDRRALGRHFCPSPSSLCRHHKMLFIYWFYLNFTPIYFTLHLLYFYFNFTSPPQHSICDANATWCYALILLLFYFYLFTFIYFSFI